MAFEVLSNENAELKLYRDGPPWQSLKTAALGDFTCATLEAGQTLLSQACERLRGEGFEAVIGPMSGDTWHSYRLVTESDDTPPFLLEPVSGAHDLSAFSNEGFDQISDYFSAKLVLEDAILHAPVPDASIQIEIWDGSNPEKLFGQVYELSRDAFLNNAFYKPISREDFLAMYMPIVPAIVPELIFFARNPCGDLLGFLFGIPNFSEGTAPESVILKTYAGLQKGVGHHLSHAFHLAALELGFSQAIHALIHDDNRSAERSAQHGAEVFRRYSLMGRLLNE